MIDTIEITYHAGQVRDVTIQRDGREPREYLNIYPASARRIDSYLESRPTMVDHTVAGREVWYVESYWPMFLPCLLSSIYLPSILNQGVDTMIDPRIVDVLYYIIAVCVDGDWMNDWLTHMPVWQADLMQEVGRLLALAIGF
jgi:hypothetical protein